MHMAARTKVILKNVFRFAKNFVFTVKKEEYLLSLSEMQIIN